MTATVIELDATTKGRRHLLTARAALRIAEAVANARTEAFPGNRAAAAAHAEILRALIPGLIEACEPCPSCGKTEPLAEVWCSRCDQPATCERTVTDGTRTYRAAYCGTCATNVGWAGMARANKERRDAEKRTR